MEKISLYGLLAVGFFLMYRRGGCCGSGHKSVDSKKDCCKENKDLNK